MPVAMVTSPLHFEPEKGCEEQKLLFASCFVARLYVGSF